MENGTSSNRSPLRMNLIDRGPICWTEKDHVRTIDLHQDRDRVETLLMDRSVISLNWKPSADVTKEPVRLKKSLTNQSVYLIL